MVPYLSKFFKYHNTVYTIFLYYYYTQEKLAVILL